MKITEQMRQAFQFRSWFPVFLLIWALLPGQLFSQNKFKEQIAQARACYEKRDWEKAVEICDKVIFQDDKATEAYVIRGAARASLGNLRGSRDDLEYAIKRGTSDHLAYCIRGALFQEEGEWEAAERAYKQGVKLAPKLALPHYFLGQLLVIQERFGAGLPHIEEALRIDPDDGDAIYYLGYYQYSRGLYKDCIGTMQRALSHKTTKEGSAYFFIGISHKLLDQFDEAESSLRRAIGYEGEAGSAWLELSMIARYRKNEPLRLACIDSAIRVAPYHRLAYRYKAEYLAENHRSEEALLYLDTALTGKIANRYLCFVWRGAALTDLGRFQEAMQEYTKAILLNDKSYLSYLGRGRTFFHMARYDKAITDLKKAQELGPEEGEPIHFLGLSYLNSSQLPEAEETFTQFTGLFPEKPFGWFNLGQAMRAQSKWGAAAESYGMALATGTLDSLNTYFYRSECFLQLDQAAKANAEMDAALKILPRDSSKDLSAAGWFLNQLGRCKESMQLLKRSAELDSTNAYTYNNLGYARLKLGQYEDAIRDFNKSIALKNDYMYLPPYNRANALRALGRYKEAIADFDLAISYKADYYEAFNDRGETWEALNEPEKAMADYRAALAIKPDYRASRLNVQRVGN